MLHDLVVLKKSLTDAYDNQRARDEINRLKTEIANIRFKCQNITQDDQAFVDDLVRYHDTVLEQLVARDQSVSDKINDINNRITDASHELFASNYNLERNDIGFELTRTERQMALYPEVEALVRSRIALYTSWQYPALEIGCRDGEWTQYLVAADPLYVMDKYQEFLDSTDSRFPEQYRQRLRKYMLKDYKFDRLPQGQFGFIFSWWHFNYVSLDTITQVLKDVRNLLRPGGVFMFSYNDGDTTYGASLAESRSQTYLPKSLLVPTCQSVGLELVESFTEAPHISWLEVKRPGNLTTVKAHQVLGKITPRTT